MAFRLIVFDLDGTLVDSRRDLAESANEVLVASGGTPHTEAAIGRLVGDGAATLVARVFQEAGRPQPADALARFLSAYNSRLLRFTAAYAGVPDLLRTLQARAVLGVLTNKPFGATSTILAGLNLQHYFGSRVVGGDGPFPRKPDPAGLLHLVASAGASPADTLLVGDSIIDWRTAQAAGAHGCVARYGFGFDGFPTDDMRAVDRAIDHPSELIGLL